MLYNILRNRLKQRTNKNFSKWLAEHKKFAGENHHILKSFMGAKKQNDYLQAELTHWKHIELTYKHEPTEDEFMEMFLMALENLQDYVDYLETKIIEVKNA